MNREERLRRFRERDFPRGDVSHDPMWTSGLDRLPTISPPTPVPPDPKFELATLPPDAVAWERVLALAGEVTDQLKAEPDFDGSALFATVTELLDSSPSPQIIVDTYRRRMQERRS